ncbi:cell division control protein 14, SIN component-domain-containing protein [Naematelia encephala]|uniref:Cell division control protein 14, SIN component-domain-containing protein n=1 Tax=Naematelia encephala TaxID=71784 RepID=A0A1Y2BKJ8_9TREE|nr:cell division control protein 14, SIN component-domain-containing protein [Naematelia encephala]
MSRPLQRHRKSQSTSALAALAEGPSYLEKRKHKDPRSRPSQHPALGRVAETSERASLSKLHQPPHMEAPVHGSPSNRVPKDDIKVKENEDVPSDVRRLNDVVLEDVREWMNQVASLRSTAAARMEALRSLEKALFQLCSPDNKSASPLAKFLKLNIHTVLLNLLARHTQILSQRTKHPHTYVRANDALVLALLPEIRSIVMLLQGMCLLSSACHADISESWVIEMLILLFMLLRLPPPLLDEMGAPLPPQDAPPTLHLVDLFSSILADSPANARKFEKLNGLEAMSRVLKVEGQVDVVKIRCMEFLHFYLMPEEPSTSRAVSSTSSSSTESQLYPPSPLDSSTSSSGSDGRISPSPRPGYQDRKSTSTGSEVPFVPQTPRKPPQPALGYLTPSIRRVSASSNSVTPSLPTVPGSPQGVPPSPSANRLSSSQKDSRWSRSEVSGNAGLGLGLPKATSSVNLSSLSDLRRDSSTRNLTDHSSSSSDPFSTINDSRASSSGSSTAVPSPRTLSRSNTQPTLHIVASSPASHDRRSSIRRVSRSPLVTSTLPEEPVTASPKTQPSSPAKPREQKIRHSRTQSHLTALTNSMPPPPVPPIPKEIDGLRTPSKARRAFPAELTKGLPPSASSPHLSSPLGPAKRMPSNPLVNRGKPMEPVKATKTVEEKKALLGNWLGNVDALVQSVEKVSMWGSKGGKSRR